MSEPLVIRCRENGPLVLPPNFKLVDHHGHEFALPQGKELIALCRCGQSRNKPFCDGMHKQCDFKAAETAMKIPLFSPPYEGGAGGGAPPTSP